MLGVARGELGDQPLGLRSLAFYLRSLGGQAGGICCLASISAIVSPRFVLNGFLLSVHFGLSGGI
jgi:hypothetical protein